MRLRLLSPLNVLERGYSITLDAAGNVIRKDDEVKGGDEIEFASTTAGIVEAGVMKRE